MLLWENIRLACNSIKSNKLRSFLTMLGIIIGISSVIAITSIGASARGAVSDEVRGEGSGLISLHMNWEKIDESSLNPNNMLKDSDIMALKQRFPSKIRYIAPSTGMPGTSKLKNSKKISFDLIGVAGNYFNNLDKTKIAKGRMISDVDVKSRSKVIVIDQKAEKKAFKGQNPIGQSITIDAGGLQEFIVIGVFEREPSLFDKLMTTDNSTGYIPYTTMKDAEGWYALQLYVNAPDDVQEIKSIGRELSEYLNKLKKEENLYVAESAEEQLSIVNKVLGTISLAIGAIAAISLLVGGIGIMNIMLVSVTERTREIGIRKSLGARTGDILTQFLIEAMLLSLAGGVIGIVLGMGIAGIGLLIVKVKFVIQIKAVVIAVLFSAGVGLFFGLFPARKAATMDPIDALRYE